MDTVKRYFRSPAAVAGLLVLGTACFSALGLLMAGTLRAEATLAGANLLYITIFDGPWKVGAGENAPILQKAMAAAAIVLWVGVMFYGRMLPFIGNAF